MFDAFSIRSRQVVFLTRLKTGQRGADALDIGDLIAAIVVEDQNMIERFMGIGEGEMGRIVGLEPHPPFFSKEQASDLLTKLDGLLSHSTPIPNSVGSRG